MYKYLSKYGSTIALIVALVISGIFLLIASTGLDEYARVSPDKLGEIDIFNFGLYAALVLLIICIAVALLFSIYQVIKDFKSSIKSIIALAGILLIFFIAYVISEPSGTESIAQLLGEFEISDTASKLISGGIWTSIVLILLTIGAVVGFEIRNAVK